MDNDNFDFIEINSINPTNLTRKISTDSENKIINAIADFYDDFDKNLDKNNLVVESIAPSYLDVDVQSAINNSYTKKKLFFDKFNFTNIDMVSKNEKSLGYLYLEFFYIFKISKINKSIGIIYFSRYDNDSMESAIHDVINKFEDDDDEKDEKYIALFDISFISNAVPFGIINPTDKKNPYYKYNK